MSVKSIPSALPYLMRSDARYPWRFIWPSPIACDASLPAATDGTAATSVCSETLVSARTAVSTVDPKSGAAIAAAMFSEPRLQEMSCPTCS